MKPESICKGRINAPESARQAIEALGVKIGKWCKKDQRFENCQVPFGKIKDLVDLGYKVNLKGPDGLGIEGSP